MTTTPPPIELAPCADALLALGAALADFVVWQDAAQRRHARVGARLRARLGLPDGADDLPAQALAEHIHPDDVDAARIVFDPAAQRDGAPTQAEIRLREADGRWRALLVRRAAPVDGAPHGLIGIGVDLTPQVQSQRQQIERLREFELTARAAGIGSWRSDGATRNPRWSPTTFELHGLDAEAGALPLKQWVERCVHPDDRDAVLRRFHACLAEGTPLLQQEFRIVRDDGRMRHLLSHTRIEGRPGEYDLYGLLQDVTEQRAAQAALREASERVALATHGAGIGTWEQDCSTSRVYWDEQMWRLRGLQPQPQPPGVAERMAIVHPDDRAQLLVEVSRASEEGRVASYDYRVQWPDGSWHWLSSRATVVRSSDGHGLRRIGVNWDVTEARSAQQARAQSLAAQRANEAKSMFLSRMSHELRTPLNAVLGFTQLLLGGGDRLPAQTRQRHLEQVELAGRHLLALIDDVLDLARLDADAMRITVQPVALRPLLEQTLPLVAELAQRHQVRVRGWTPELQVSADPTRLRQVLLNLLSNAVKYNRPGGEVWIETAGDDAGTRIAVCDNGRGLSAVELEQAFEPFNRLGRDFEGIEGTGIGLSIVRALVERMGGTLHATSAPGQGSRFELNLPAADGLGTGLPAAPCLGAATGRTAAAALADAAGPNPPAPARPGPPRPPGELTRQLLYVDDNPVHVALLRELVTRRPQLRLDSATDGSRGVRRAQQAPPDLILLDLQLPDTDGITVLRQLRAEPATARIPCIAVAPSPSAEQVEQALAAGFDACWSQPLDFVNLERLLDDWYGPAAA